MSLTRVFTGILFLSVTATASTAQILNQTTLQPNANFNISGFGVAGTFQATTTSSSGGNGIFQMSESPNNLLRWALGMINPESSTNLVGSDYALFS